MCCPGVQMKSKQFQLISIRQMIRLEDGWPALPDVRDCPTLPYIRASVSYMYV